jgi:hypothetical protein
MSTDTAVLTPVRTAESLPTALCSVVWSQGHCFVREGFLGRSRWVGVDSRGRALSLTDADLRRRGWSLRRA